MVFEVACFEDCKKTFCNQTEGSKGLCVFSVLDGLGTFLLFRSI